MASVIQTQQSISDKNDAAVLNRALEDIRLDLAALRTAITGITAKLDADAGVTDTNYAATQNPAALRTTP